MAKTGECKLCDKTEKLVKSHIVPESFYLKGGNLRIASSEYKAPKRSPIGEYDHFLCNSCEKIFNEWDDYGTKIFSERKKEIHRIDGGIEVEIIKKINEKEPDIQKAKLFFLSILWRAHCSTHDFSKQVNLEDTHCKLIKEILLKKIKLQLNDYSILLTKCNKDENRFEELCFNAESKKIDNINFYLFHLGNIGYQFYIKVDQKLLPKCFEEIYLGYNNFISILIDDELKNKNLLRTNRLNLK